MHKISPFWALALALPLTLACSSDKDEVGGGGLDQALGAQMSELSDLGDRFIGENQATYDTLDQASELIGAALGGGAPAASTAPKQEAGCLPPELAGTTVLVDVQSNTWTPTTPQGPDNAVQFRLLSDPQTEVGFVNITCTGAFPSLNTVDISVNTGGVEVLQLTASSISVFPPSNFLAFLAGTLRSASGDDEVPFGVFGFEGNSSISLDEFSRSTSTAFGVGADVSAFVTQTVTPDPAFEEIFMVVAGPPIDFFEDLGELPCLNDFRFDGFMTGTPGNVSGGSIFCARPPLADGFNYFVNCFDGSIDNMVVSQAQEACNTLFAGDPTQVSQGVLNDIQAGTNALLGMHNTVISVAEAGAEVAFQLAAAAQ